MSKARELAALGNAYSDGALSNRNLIINGAMQVAQRGTSFTASTGFTLDRYACDVYDSTQTISQDTDAPEGFDYSAKYQNGASVENSYYLFMQRIEKRNFERLSGQTVTLSFYVKGSQALSGVKWYAEVKQSSGASPSQSFNGAYDISTSWERIVVNITLGSFSGYTITDSGSLMISPLLQAGGAAGIPANMAIWITGVQLEVGDTATPFEHRSYGQELALAQRFFCAFNSDSGTNTALCNGLAESSTAIRGICPLPVQMRAVPTVTVSDITHFRIYTTSGFAFTSGGIGGLSKTALGIFANTSGGMTAGHAGQVLWNSASGHVHVDAEL